MTFLPRRTHGILKGEFISALLELRSPPDILVLPNVSINTTQFHNLPVAAEPRT